MFCLYEQWDFNPHVSPIHSLVSTRMQKSLLVDTATQCVQRMYDRASGTDDPFSYGCFSQGLGSTLGLPQNLGSLVPRGERRSRKHLRIGSGLQSVRHVATQVGGLGCPGRTGQLDSSCILEQAEAPDRVDSVVWPHSFFFVATHSRGQERDCRRPIKTRGDCSGRVEYQSSSFPTPVQSLGYSNRRLVRHEVQLTLTSVRLSGPRRKSHGGRRDVPELEGNVGI